MDGCFNELDSLVERNFHEANMNVFSDFEAVFQAIGNSRFLTVCFTVLICWTICLTAGLTFLPEYLDVENIEMMTVVGILSGLFQFQLGKEVEKQKTEDP